MTSWRVLRRSRAVARAAVRSGCRRRIRRVLVLRRSRRAVLSCRSVSRADWSRRALGGGELSGLWRGSMPRRCTAVGFPIAFLGLERVIMSNRSARLMSRKDARAVKLAQRAYLSTPVGSESAFIAATRVAELERAAVRRAAARGAERALLAALRAPLAPVRSADVLASQSAAVRSIAGAE